MNEELGPYCLVLCDPKLGDLYRSHFGELAQAQGLELDFVSDPEAFTRSCLGRSPMAGLADMGSIIRCDSEKMNQLFDFRVRWPVIRSKIGSDGTGQLMRMRPPLQGDSLEALGEIQRGGSAWMSADETRQHLRASVRCRGRIGPAGEEPGQCVSIYTLSQAGCLILTDTPPEVGTRLALEIRDLPGGEAQLKAQVVWCWQWQDTVKSPRAGLVFESRPPAEVLDALRAPEFSETLC